MCSGRKEGRICLCRPCWPNLDMQGVNGKSYFSYSFQMIPMDNMHAVWSSFSSALQCSARAVYTTRHNYSRKWNYHNIYPRLRENISEHLSSEKPPPPSTYNHKNCFHARRQSERRASVICGLWVWPHKTCCLTKVVITPSVGLSCYVASGLMRLDRAGFLSKPLF